MGAACSRARTTEIASSWASWKSWVDKERDNQEDGKAPKDRRLR
jgi:hypothetical protein